MTQLHEARIHWSNAQVAHGLPSFERSIDPAWFVEPGPGSEEAWSLKCEFSVIPAVQGTPTRASVEFMVPNAPHERLRPGVWLELFERATRQRARVEILT